MAEYQTYLPRTNRFAMYPGVPLREGRLGAQGRRLQPPLRPLRRRANRTFLSGTTGLLSLICGFIAFEIIGLNMFASVHWNPVQFVRQLPWLALERPRRRMDCTFPPAGRRLVVAGRPFPHQFGAAVVASHVSPRRALGMGTTWRGVRRRHLADARAGIIRPVLMGSFGEAVLSASSRTSTGWLPSRYVTATSSTTRSIACRSPSCTAPRCCSPCMPAPFSR